MRKALLAGAAALALTMAAPRQARADLSFGDLESALEAVIAALIETAETPPGIILDRILAVLGLAEEIPDTQGVVAYPVNPEEADQFAVDLDEDRKERVEAVDRLATGYLQQADDATIALRELEAANAAAQPSVNAQLAILGQAAITTAGSVETQTALLAGLAKIEADRARQETLRAAQRAKLGEALAPNGTWAGNGLPPAGTIELDF